jgi:6-phosphogluconate dehydrogenase
MGANLARNAAQKDARVAVYNRTQERTEEFMERHGKEGDIRACRSLKELREALTPPRPILLMVKAGTAVDEVIRDLLPLLSEGDILIDGGNSFYRDTEERATANPKLRFLGMGVSGGEKGALKGPSLMPGGHYGAYKELEPLFHRMAADDGDGGKCVAYLGPGGAGHFVKMVHNGVEYGLMQLIAESYDLLRSEGGRSNEELAEIYAAWNSGDDLQSYLLEITARIFEKKDPETGKNLIDLIKDVAGEKGTGKWTLSAAHDDGVPVPSISAAVEERILSGALEHRRKARVLPEVIEQPYPKPEKLTSRIRIALELSMICTYTQGFELLAAVSSEEQWNLNLGEIARIWRGGCIIRSAFLKKLQAAYVKNRSEEILLRFQGDRQLDWRRAITTAIGRGIPVPAMAASLAYYDALRRERLPQNLIQAQRDFFGAHGYERMDHEGMFHTEWEE